VSKPGESRRGERVERGEIRPAPRSVIAAVALGSNLGDRRATLDAAVSRIAGLSNVRVLAVSEWFETEPVGGPAGQGRFLNGALIARTTLGARAFLAELARIELELGRDRRAGVRHGPRTLDLDLLVHGDERHDEPDLRVPHPRLAERAFVLEPLASIAPDLVVPDSAAPTTPRDAHSSVGRAPTVRELLAALAPASKVLSTPRPAAAR